MGIATEPERKVTYRPMRICCRDCGDPVHEDSGYQDPKDLTKVYCRECGKKHDYREQKMLYVKYPRIIAHIIAHSLGYCTPKHAMKILQCVRHNFAEHSEWIWSCYQADPRKAVAESVKFRHSHKGSMKDYRIARQLVAEATKDDSQPQLASWF